MAAPTASKNGSSLDALDEAILGTDSTIVYNASKSPATARWQFSPWSAVLTYIQTALASLAQQFASIEIGHATDTTLSRVSAGVVAVEGKTVGLLSVANVWTAQQNFGAAAITSTAASIAWDVATAQVAKHTATENTTLANPTNMVDGGHYEFRWKQHASAVKTLAFGNAYAWSGGVAPTVTTTVNAVDIFTFVCDGALMHGAIRPDSKVPA